MEQVHHYLPLCTILHKIIGFNFKVNCRQNIYIKHVCSDKFATCNIYLQFGLDICRVCNLQELSVLNVKFLYFLSLFSLSYYSDTVKPYSLPADHIQRMDNNFIHLLHLVMSCDQSKNNFCRQFLFTKFCYLSIVIELSPSKISCLLMCYA